jgi:dTDP-4-amino-4,6-dideoxygalactose transaminase
MDFTSIGQDRREVMEFLKTRSIGTQVHYIPVHLQPYYRQALGHGPGDFPIAEDYYAKALSLPLYPAMRDEDVLQVIEGVREALRQGAGA